VVLFIVTGWGITRTDVIYKITFGLMDRRLADSIHRGLNAPVAFFFLLHVLINIRRPLAARFSGRTWLVDGVLIAIGVAVLGIAVYMEYFRLGG